MPFIPTTYNPLAIYDLFSVQGAVCDLSKAPALVKAKVLESLGLGEFVRKAKDLAGKETRDTFTRLSNEGNFADLHMGIHNKVLAKHLDAQVKLAGQPKVNIPINDATKAITLTPPSDATKKALDRVTESGYFATEEHLSPELAQQGWENTIHAVVKG
jgi:hypothetical protein